MHSSGDSVKFRGPSSTTQFGTHYSLPSFLLPATSGIVIALANPESPVISKTMAMILSILTDQVRAVGPEVYVPVIT